MEWLHLAPRRSQECLAAEQQMVFGLLGAFGQHMVALGVSADDTRTFLSNKCLLHSLPSDLTASLLASVSLVPPPPLSPSSKPVTMGSPVLASGGADAAAAVLSGMTLEPAALSEDAAGVSSEARDGDPPAGDTQRAPAVATKDRRPALPASAGAAEAASSDASKPGSLPRAAARRS